MHSMPLHFILRGRENFDILIILIVSLILECS